MFTRTIFTASGASVQTTGYRLTGLCLALIAYSTAFSVPPQALQWRNPLPQGNQLNGITYGRGVFVAVGSTGTILTSTDANEWIYHHVEAPSLKAVSYGDGLFVAVGENGAILTSTNGDEWALRYSPTTNNLLAVTYGNGRFVVAGRCVSDYCDTLSDTILVSLDGAKWSLIDLEDQLGYTFGLQAVTYGNSLFVAAGDDGILTSPDGINWARQDWRTCTAVTFSGSAFVASICCSGVLSSDDATNWTYIDVGVGVCLDSIASDGHILVVVGESGTIDSSPDGLSWIKEPSGTSDTLLGVTFGNGVLVAVGENGQILTSADGQSWTSRRTGITDPLFSVAHGNGLFVAISGQVSITSPGGRDIGIGRDGILTSTDGTTWHDQITGTTNLLSGVVFANGIFLIFGNSGLIMTSSDGSDWRTQQSGTTNSIYGIAYGAGIYAAVGGGRGAWDNSSTILVSSNALTWYAQSSPVPNRLRGVAYRRDRFAAVGENGVILTSRDGLTWTACRASTTNTLLAVTTGHDLFVAVGERGSIVTSPDAVHWTEQNSGSVDDIAAISFGNGVFAALPNQLTFGRPGGRMSSFPITDLVLTSKDTISWSTWHTGTANRLKGLSFANGSFIAVGDVGTIVQFRPHLFGREL